MSLHKNPVTGLGFRSAGLIVMGVLLTAVAVIVLSSIVAFSWPLIWFVLLMIVGAVSLSVAVAVEFKKRLKKRIRHSEIRQERAQVVLNRAVDEVRSSVERTQGYAEAKAASHHAVALKHAGSISILAKKSEVLRQDYEALNDRFLERVFQLALASGARADLFSAEEIRGLALKHHEDDPLAVFWLLDASDSLYLLPLSARRKLANGLRARGYLARSLEVLETVVSKTNTDRDKFALRQRQNEMQILREGYVRKLTPASDQKYEPLRGHVMHVVGKGLPSVQSGYTLRTHYTALAQRNAGMHVTVVSQAGSEEGRDEAGINFVDDIPYYDLAGPSRRNLTMEEWLDLNVERLGALVEKLRPGLLHAHSDFFNAISAEAVGDRYGIPVVYESRGFWEESWLSRMTQKFSIHSVQELEAKWGLPDTYKWRQERERQARMACDHVFTLARVMSDHILEQGGDAKPIDLVPNAVNASEFPVLERDSELAASLGIDDQTTVIGYVSSIVEYEGIDTLIEAFDIVSKSREEDVKLLLVGDGPMLSSLKTQADRLGVANDVVFTGRVDHSDVLKYYSVIDLFVIPRRPTRVCELVTPLKPFEAFSTGRTVVMSDVGALREISDDSGAALLFQAGNPSSLAEVLNELIANPEEAKRYAKRGAEWVRAERTWDSNAQTYLSVYGEMGVKPYGEDDYSIDIGYDVGIEAVISRIAEQSPANLYRWFDTETGASASEIMNVGWALSGFPAASLSLPIDWDTLCARNRSWAFHLHAWEFMDPVMLEYVEAGDFHLLDWCIERALSWTERFLDSDTAADGTMAWYDMALGLRSPRLVALIVAAIKAGIDSDKVSLLLASAMKHRQEHAQDGSFNPRTNHGYYAAVGQTVLGEVLSPLPGMVRLQLQGQKRLRHMASSQFKSDGVHSEHSPDYHRMVLDSFELGIQQGLITDELVVDRMKDASYALGWMIKPDGHLVQFGDTPERDMRSSTLPKSTDPHTKFLMTAGAEGKPNLNTMAVYQEAGYAFVRSPQPTGLHDHGSASYLAFSSAFHSRAHKHADDQNFVWSDRGREILVDAGRYAYGELLPADSPLRLEGYYYAAKERQYVESTMAHNTVMIGSENHNRRKRSPYGSGLGRCEQHEDTYTLTGSVNHEAWSHERLLTFKPRERLIVLDKVASTDGQMHSFTCWFNFEGHLNLEVVQEDLVRITSDEWIEPLWMAHSGGALIPPVRGQENPIRGWRSLRDRSLIETWSVGFKMKEEYSGNMVTDFSFGKQPRDIG